ncbi:MAG: sigma factor-like helix-turn-helix DNA-binding protein [Longicatena sp.]
MIDQTQHINDLLDAYEPLLTDKQKVIMDYYYKEDLSLAEIAEELAVSRSAINDHIKRSTQILEEYEKKLNLVANYRTRSQIYAKMKAIGHQDYEALIEQLENIE